MTLTPSEIIAWTAQLFFVIVALAAAKTTYRTIALGDRADLPKAIFWSVTKTVFFVGPVLFIAVLWLFLSDAPRGDTGGIMSKGTAVVVVSFGAALALTTFWTTAVILGLIAAALARNLPIRLAMGVVLVALLVAPSVCATSVVIHLKMEQHRRSMKQRR